ncbi:MAG: hypothetical protein K8F60_18480 [Melioribacteraceae bacterium]|jgi:predicted nucleic acid-binding protein|nr:hypothetical protein [Melioribacteraceae bacterium]
MAYTFYFLLITAYDSDRKTAKQFLEDLLKFIHIAPVDTEKAKLAFRIHTKDFEDALQMSSAISCKAEFIITRNVKHYKKSPIKAVTPEEFLKLLN